MTLCYNIFHRKLGKYVLILWNILRHDLVPFIVVSIITLLIFTGSMYFLLCEEEKRITTRILNTTLHNGGSQKFITSLDAFPEETGYMTLALI